jgi:hypothetical protein
MKLSEIKTDIVTNWKKYLIVGGCFLGLLIISNVGTGISCYCKGTKTCKAEAPKLTPIKSTTIINKPKDKNSVCGNEIFISTNMVTDKKLQIIAADQCKKTTAFYSLDSSCPVKKHQIGIGPSLLFVYDNEAAKFSYLIGGTLSYTHYWGNFGLQPQLHGYYGLGGTAYAGSIDLLLNYRW